MMRDDDRCVRIPLRVAAIVVLWTCGIGLVVWQSFGGPSIAGETWGVVFVCGAAAMSVSHAIARHNRMLRQAFELGQETERAKLTVAR